MHDWHRKMKNDDWKTADRDHAQFNYTSIIHVTHYTLGTFVHSLPIYLFKRGIFYFRRIKRVYNADVFRAHNATREVAGKRGRSIKHGDWFERSTASRRYDVTWRRVQRKKSDKKPKHRLSFSFSLKLILDN